MSLTTNYWIPSTEGGISICLFLSLTLCCFAARRFGESYTKNGDAPSTWGRQLEDLILGRTAGPYKPTVGDKELLTVLPGWAVRRKNHDGTEKLEVHVSGFSSISRGPKNTSISLRLSLWLAKYFIDESNTYRAHSRVERDIENDVNFTAPGARRLQSLHNNLDHRFGLLWSDPLLGRKINLRIFVEPLCQSEEGDIEPQSNGSGLLASADVITIEDGSFDHSFKVDWHEYTRCLDVFQSSYPSDKEARVLIVAESTPPNSQTLRTTCRILITTAQIRVVSDIDDTVKHSGVVSGHRSILHNVFCNDVKDTVLPDVSAWYQKLYNRGIRFHYVSNGPLAYSTILAEFISIAKLPPGSITLRSFTGRLFEEINRSTAGIRKARSILKVLDDFPESQFILIGDTGEMDLECYTKLSVDRPKQILAVYLRDANTSTPRGLAALEDPVAALNLILRDSDRRTIFQKRLYESRRQIPPHVVLRVFRDPEECIEIDTIVPI